MYLHSNPITLSSQLQYIFPIDLQLNPKNITSFFTYVNLVYVIFNLLTYHILIQCLSLHSLKEGNHAIYL